jgi:hypothetical protein
MPRYAAVLLPILVFGAIGGADFGVRGFYDELLGFTHQGSLEAVERFPTAANVLFYWPGPLFPLALLLIGIGLLKSRLSPRWMAILVCAVGVAFPLSRVPRISWLAHVVDAAIVVAFCGLAYLSVSERRERTIL